jgi:alpha-1,2-mannosyltransferase
MAVIPWPALVIVSTALSGAALTFVLYQLTRPLARRGEWDPWLTAGVAVVAAVAFEPVTDTLGFGQVNLVLLALVTADLLLLSGTRRGAGVLIGLAAAVKLTPAVFILYLLISGRRREALTATLTAAGATIAAAMLAPQASYDFWTHALWQTDRVGSLSIAGNQSLRGLTARLAPHHTGVLLWLIAVLAVLAVWAVAVRRISDVRLGLALTGVLSCLVSPITWVHHLVWLIPAMVLLVERAVDTRRRWLFVAAIGTYAVLDSRIVFLFDPRYTGWSTAGPGQLGGSAFVLVSAFLGVSLAAVPARSRAPRQQPAPDRISQAW